MPVGALEEMGYLLWEGMMLITIILGTLGFVAIRRKINGRPAFSAQDRKLLFNTPVGRPAMHVCFRFALAMLLFTATALFEIPLFASFGAAILFVSLLVSCAGIINFTLL
jgi:hypothetical protein